MIYRALADLIMLMHFGFVLFVVFGGFLILRRPWVVWLHLPVALYGAAIEIVGWTCPLTPLEQRLRLRAGAGGYEGGFLDHYLGLLLYPSNWEAIKGFLAAGVLLVNLAVYATVLRQLQRRRLAEAPPPQMADAE